VTAHLDYVVRAAGAADIPELVAQRLAMFAEMGVSIDEARLRDGFSSWLTPHLASGDYHAWLVETTAGAIVGGGAVTIVPWPPGPRDYSGRLPIVFNVYTHPAHRSRGLARALMQTIHAWCRAQGFGTIGLSASAAGRPLYESMGYEASPTPYMFAALET
jgi:GNAT superfamily N-acetyltransferase